MLHQVAETAIAHARLEVETLAIFKNTALVAVLCECLMLSRL